MLGPETCPLYRPDVKGVAYWEFELVGLKRPAPRGVKNPRVGTGTGFIVIVRGPSRCHFRVGLDRNAPAGRSTSNSPIRRRFRGRDRVRIERALLCRRRRGAEYLGHLGSFRR